MIGKGTYSPQDFEKYKKLRWLIVGKYCSIAKGVTIFNEDQHRTKIEPLRVNNYPTEKFRRDQKGTYKINKLIIGHDVWIGQNAVLFAGITIGNGAIIGAYSVVAKSIPPYAVAVGNPVQIKRIRFREDQIKELEKIQWWNWNKRKIRQAAPYMYDVDMFIQYVNKLILVDKPVAK